MLKVIYEYVEWGNTINTSINGSIVINDLLGFSPRIVKPDWAVSKVVVFSGQVLGKDGAIRQSVGIRTIERVVAILAGIVAITWNEVENLDFWDYSDFWQLELRAKFSKKLLCKSQLKG